MRHGGRRRAAGHHGERSKQLRQLRRRRLGQLPGKDGAEEPGQRALPRVRGERVVERVALLRDVAVQRAGRLRVGWDGVLLLQPGGEVGVEEGLEVLGRVQQAVHVLGLRRPDRGAGGPRELARHLRSDSKKGLYAPEEDCEAKAMAYLPDAEAEGLGGLQRQRQHALHHGTGAPPQTPGHVRAPAQALGRHGRCAARHVATGSSSRTALLGDEVCGREGVARTREQHTLRQGRATSTKSRLVTIRVGPGTEAPPPTSAPQCRRLLL